MPLKLPPFVQYQSPLVPLRGLWRRPPVEGEFFINCEVDWLLSPPGQAVQFAVSGNSPINLSQIVALAVDNGRCGGDVDFIFPDSGFILTVPAHNQGVFPVFTNALMFYASAPNSALGDKTVFQIFNAMPPVISIAPSQAQNVAFAGTVSLANGTTPIIPAPTTGTLNTVMISAQATSAGQAVINLVDGTGRFVWSTIVEFTAAGTENFPLSGLSIRFFDGLNIVVGSSSLTGNLIVNLYYSTP